jgi:hypothetical protein
MTQILKSMLKKELYSFLLLINYYSRAVVISLLIKQKSFSQVAKVVNDKPDFECMVEGHTDSVPYVTTYNDTTGI